jgi:hypothetical protein
MPAAPALARNGANPPHPGLIGVQPARPAAGFAAPIAAPQETPRIPDPCGIPGSLGIPALRAVGQAVLRLVAAPVACGREAQAEAPSACAVSPAIRLRAPDLQVESPVTALRPGTLRELEATAPEDCPPAGRMCRQEPPRIRPAALPVNAMAPGSPEVVRRAASITWPALKEAASAPRSFPAAPAAPGPQLPAHTSQPNPFTFESVPHARPAALPARKGSRWSAVPRPLKAVAVTAAAAVAVIWAWGAGPGDAFVRRLESRAAIELHEDFAAGTERWTGAARNWVREPAGFVRTGALALLRPSIAMSDYRLEFLGQIERRGLSWVFRAADLQNYYVMKLAIAKPGPLPVMALVRYEVIAGRVGQPVRVPIRLVMHNDTPYRVRLDVKGSGFTTYIEDQLVDFWSDDRLTTGGAGFFSDNDERAQIYWVKVSHQTDFLGKACAFFAPSPIEKSYNGSPK